MKRAITGCRIYTGEQVLEDKSILTDNGVITAIEDTVPEGYHILDLEGQNIAPGLIDIQVNGGELFYFSEDTDRDALQRIAEDCHKYATAYFLPTLISSGQKKILDALDTVRSFMQRHPEAGVLGMHLEGPFINPEKRGTHNEMSVRKATDREIEEIAYYGKDVIRLMTIAPEMLTDAQIDVLQRSGIRLSIGHSNLTYEQAQTYFDRGISMVTHLFNAMSDFSHRSPGLVGAALDNDSVYTPVILDGRHAHYVADRIAYRCKGDKLLLTTDCAFLGRQVDRFSWEDFNVVLKDGSYVNDEGHLAGSAISMPEAIQNAVQHLHASRQEAIEMATGRVARAIGMDSEIGFIKPGMPTSFFVFGEQISKGKSLIWPEEKAVSGT